MFAHGVPMPQKIILRRTVLIQGGIGVTKHTSVGTWRWGRQLRLGEILKGSQRRGRHLGSTLGASEGMAAISGFWAPPHPHTGPGLERQRTLRNKALTLLSEDRGACVGVTVACEYEWLCVFAQITPSWGTKGLLRASPLTPPPIPARPMWKSETCLHFSSDGALATS